ncbi:unnamed protein product [Rhizophagus irregularis]|nr:unnamed protein product [Rhizophagus irregularis]
MSRYFFAPKIKDEHHGQIMIVNELIVRKRTGIGFALDQLYRLRVFRYFRLISTLRLWILIGFTSLDFNRYQFDSFGFELVSALGLGFWIGIGFGSLGFGSVGFASLDISDRYRL